MIRETLDTGPVRPMFDRLPPHNLEAEQGVLGSILLDNDVLHEIASVLAVDCFYRDAHQVTYRAILDLYQQGSAIDAFTLSDELERRNQVETVGGVEFLADLSRVTPHPANARYYADIVKQKYISRRVVDATNAILREAYSNELTASQLLESAERRVFAIADEQVSPRLAPMSDVVDRAMETIMQRRAGEIEGILTGFRDLDDMLGGLKPEHLAIIAARPSMGKTALAQAILNYISVKLKTASLLVSLEMSAEQIGERGLSSVGRVDGYKLRSGHALVGRDEQGLHVAYRDLQNAPIWVDDTACQGMLQIMATARRLKARHGLGLIVIDYIQLIDSEDGRASRQEQVSAISRRLKVLARELRVPVIALSQLNRKAEDREDKRPRLADLRESGAIEQDADMVLLLHRPDYYDPNDQPGTAEIIVAKNRHGGTGTVKLAFSKPFVTFDSLAPFVPPADGEAY